MKVWTNRRWRLGLPIMLLSLTAVYVSWAAQNRPVTRHGYQVVAQFPHNRRSFTQGFLVHQGKLIEGTGQYGESKLLQVDLESGRVLKQVELPKQYFGEGTAICQGELFQLTWKSRVGFVYDPETFQLIRTVRYAGEGWGLTSDGQSLIMSDGSGTLRFLNPKTFEVERRVIVHEGDTLIKSLNELEYIQGEIWANIWYKDEIVKIDPTDGSVTGWIDLKGLKPRSLFWNREAVYNGIAYDEATQKIYVTGKNWPVIYEIELTEQ